MPSIPHLSRGEEEEKKKEKASKEKTGLGMDYPPPAIR